MACHVTTVLIKIRRDYGRIRHWDMNHAVCCLAGPILKYGLSYFAWYGLYEFII